MTAASSPTGQFINLVRAYLDNELEITPEVIDAKVRIVQGHMNLTASEIQQVHAELRELYAVWIGKGAILEDSADHEPWLVHRRGSIDWSLYGRYRKYLTDQGWHPRTVSRLDELSEEILGRLEDPHRSGAWDRRGMVVGQVQSGKTASYTAVINRALDAGYPLVIVLAGRFNDLRSQTQQRIDEGVLGYDTRTFGPGENFSDHRIGVGLLKGHRNRHINSPTTNANNGDFSASSGGVKPGKDPMVMVVKKQKTVLTRLLKWCRNLSPMPVLIIDDEADDSSVNTRKIYDDDGHIDLETDPTTINGLIRQLLGSFERRCYLGYTATPYANIFIQREGHSQKYGEDLFPRSFIISLPAPDNYVGPEQIFGLNDDPILGTGRTGLDIVRPVDDWSVWLPAKHTKEWVPGPLPESVHRALRCFILSTAARRARGQGTKHASMLIHGTRLKAVQKKVAAQILAEIRSLQERIRYGLHGDTIRQELRELWMEEFAVPDLTWEQIDQDLTTSSAELVVMTINGDARDSLQYYNHRKTGLKVIAIGGDKLSRGLTLEGLSVSYYLRNAGAYDTLLQMGRWFGYRPGYLDLCRIFTTGTLIEQYAHVTVAAEELRQQLERMAELEMTPEEFGLRVRTDPDQVLTVTARNKMFNAFDVELSYANSLSEQVTFLRSEQDQEGNRKQVEHLLSSAGSPQREGERTSVIWRDVDAGLIVELLRRYRVPRASSRMLPGLLADYVEQRVGTGRLVNWTVVLVSNTQAGDHTTLLAGHEVGLIQRRQVFINTDRISIRRLLSPTDESLDLTPEQRRACLTAYAGRDGQALKFDPFAARSFRSPERGLLLIYPLDIHDGRGKDGNEDATSGQTGTGSALQALALAVSFPRDDSAIPMKYKANDVVQPDEDWGDGE